ncbi:hypothetical protein MMJ17_23975, partial [Bacillus spizizenii]|nr:hypothetical protein [Bacillus spizizenii]
CCRERHLRYCGGILQNFDSIRGTRSYSFALLGQPGSGKTLLLTAISNKLIKSTNIVVQYFH